jgi:serine/threonine-protein kinase RsbW
VPTSFLLLEFEAEPENIGAARLGVADLAEGFGVKEPALGDLKTMVSEACTNVVRHAYPAGHGRFEVEAFRADGQLWIVVRDFGQGMQAEVESGEPSLRLGLGLISMLSSDFEISSGAEGTELRMRLPLPPSPDG